MVKRNRILVVLAVAALLLVSLGSDLRANFALSMQRPGDPSPQRIEAALDLGLIAFSVLVTWSKRLDY